MFRRGEIKPENWRVQKQKRTGRKKIKKNGDTRSKENKRKERKMR